MLFQGERSVEMDAASIGRSKEGGRALSACTVCSLLLRVGFEIGCLSSSSACALLLGIGSDLRFSNSIAR